MKIEFAIFLLALLLSNTAYAHSFMAEGGEYEFFIEGIKVVLSDVQLILPVIALSLLVSLWKIDGILSVWPAYIIGNLLGIPLATFVTGYIIQLYISLGIFLALFAALAPKRNHLEIRILAAVIGLTSMLTVLEGHEFLELPSTIYLGLLFGLNLVLVVSANISSLILKSLNTTWANIGIRAVAAWVAAIGILIFAVNV